MTVDEIDYTTGLPVDVAYNVKATVAQEIFERELRRYRALSAQAVDGLEGHTDLVYDETSGERLDVWGIDGAPRPALIVIHGGYWKALSRHDATFMARVMADVGVATVAVDYTLAPQASLQEIVRRCGPPSHGRTGPGRITGWTPIRSSSPDLLQVGT